MSRNCGRTSKPSMTGIHQVYQDNVVTLPGDHCEADCAILCGMDLKSVEGFDTCR